MKQKNNYWGVKPLKFNNTWNVKPIKTFNFRLNLDTDRDGVLDFKDCQPFNWRRQDEHEVLTRKESIAIAKKVGSPYGSSLSKHKKALKERVKYLPIIKVVNGYGVYAWEDNGDVMYEIIDMKTGVNVLSNRKSLEEALRDIKNHVPEEMMMMTFHTTNMDEYIKKDYVYVLKDAKRQQKYGGRSKRFKQVKGQKVLDIGAGISPDVRATHAIDLEKPDETFSNLKYQWGYDFNKETTDLPYPDNYFNVVVSYGALGRNFWSKNIFRESYRVLKLGGHFELHVTPKTNKMSVEAMKDVGFKNIKTKSYYNEPLQENIPVLFAKKV